MAYIKLTPEQKIARKRARLVLPIVLRHIRTATSYADAVKFCTCPAYMTRQAEHFAQAAGESAVYAARYAFEAHPELRA